MTIFKLSKPQKPKIAFVLGLQVPFQGAAWRRIEFFARYLASKNFIVYVLGSRTFYITCIGGSKDGDSRRRASFKIINVPLKLHVCASPFLTSLFEAISSLLTGLVLLLIKPKVVILSIPPFHYLVGTYVFARLSRAKFIVDVRDPIDHSYIRYKGLKKLKHVARSIEYAMMYRANTIVCVSEVLARDISRALAHLSTKMYVVPNGADLKVFKPVKKVGLCKPQTFKVFFMGRTTEGYNLSAVLKALSLLRREYLHVKLYIAGVFDPTLFREAKQLEVLDSIVYLGVLSADELVNVMNEMGLAVLPYYNDKSYRYSLPAKFYEYVACGLPVLVSAPPYFEVAKIVRDHGIGIWCPAEDVSCIASAIKRLYEDRSKLMALIERCLLFRNSIDRTNSAERLFNIIKRLVDSVTS